MVLRSHSRAIQQPRPSQNNKLTSFQVGDKYPDATFTGIDLSPIQPNLVPENVHFFIDDFEEEWVDPVNKYDYIHVRHTLHSVQNPQLLFQRAMQ